MEASDFRKHVADLERLLKLRSFPFGMTLFARREEMERIPKIRRPKAIQTLDQVVAQAARLGWTVGVTAEDLVGSQCRAVVGLGNAKDRAWSSGERMVGVWYATVEDASAHQAAMNCVEDGRYEALAVSPYPSGEPILSEGGGSWEHRVHFSCWWTREGERRGVGQGRAHPAAPA